MRLLLATHNKHKRREFARLLERKFIYRTPYFKPFEATAREHLKMEIERLGKTVEAQV